MKNPHGIKSNRVRFHIMWGSTTIVWLLKAVDADNVNRNSGGVGGGGGQSPQLCRGCHNRTFVCKPQIRTSVVGRNVSEQFAVGSLRTFGSRNSTCCMIRNPPHSISDRFAAFLRFRYLDFPYARLAPRWHLGAALGAAISNSPGAQKQFPFFL